MSDALPEDAWVSSFLPTPPRPLLSALQRRLAGATTHVNALAELYKQRAAIEQQYADALSKLARTAEQGGLNGKNATDWERGGGESKIWESVLTDLTETSTSHSTLAAMLRTDFEQPVRDLPSKVVHWRRIGEQDANLDKKLKDYEKVSGKLEKASGKKAGKADSYQMELNQITQDLSTLSPMVYTTYQRLDEQRFKSLKEIIVRWSTARGDIASKEGERAEHAVADLLGWEPADEVLAVGARLGGSGGSRAGSMAPSLNTTPQSRRISTAQDLNPRQNLRQNGSSTNVNTPPPSSFGLKSMLGRSKTLARNRSSSNATSRTGRDREPTESIHEDRQSIRETPTVDEEGYSLPPPDRHKSLWDDPDEEIGTPAMQSTPIKPMQPSTATTQGSTLTVPPTSNFAQHFDSSPSASAENLSTHSGSNRINLAIAPAPIQETEQERQAALQKMQQTLQMPNQPSRRSTVRGRRDVRNTMFGTPGLSEEPDALGANGHRPGVGRQGSVSSFSSNNPFDSPGLMTAPALPTGGQGLRASITEVINVIMHAGQIQRLQINGEIHVGLNGASGDGIHIRLDAFERLEKIAPNPQYLLQVPDRPGEYLLNSETLAAASKSPKGTLLFKYQVHVSPGNEKVPLIMEPAFLCKDGETRMILNYRLNSDTAQLSALSLVAAFDAGPSVSNVQAKPAGGVWSPSTRKMTWEMGDFQGPEGKIIAKFTSEPGESLKPQGVQATWAVEGALASGIDLDVVGSGWSFEQVTKGLTTGKYLAEAVIN